MKTYILAFFFVLPVIANADEALRAHAEKVYSIWREALVKKDFRAWKEVTAEHRQVEVRNRIVSEKLSFPEAIFDLPAPPPELAGLKFLEAVRNGKTLKASYFGKVDFGVGGEPTDNLLVLSFVQGPRHFMYDKANFVNLTALPEVRTELAAGDLSYLKGVPEAQPSGVVPETPRSVRPAQTIAKVYVFCPGREVEVVVNKVSRHRFANAKEADTVMGGAKEGENEIHYKIKKLEGGTGEEALTIRVYFLSEVAGVQPIKAFEYLVKEKEAFEPSDTKFFALDSAAQAKLLGK